MTGIFLALLFGAFSTAAFFTAPLFGADRRDDNGAEGAGMSMGAEEAGTTAVPPGATALHPKAAAPPAVPPGADRATVSRDRRWTDK